jgi:hypothetical protein
MRDKHVSFSVPADVKAAPQSGWVYRSDAAPAAPSRPAPSGWIDRARELMVVSFSLPFCLLLSLAPSPRRPDPSK